MVTEDLWPSLAGNPALSPAAFYVIVLTLQSTGGTGCASSRLVVAVARLHHAQRDMTFWTDDRTISSTNYWPRVVMAAVALAIGVPPTVSAGAIRAQAGRIALACQSALELVRSRICW